MPDKQHIVPWEKKALEKFDAMIAKMPLFHRDIAKNVVSQKAHMNAQGRGAADVQEKDVVSAFFTEVPKAFYSLMIRLMDEVGFDYQDFLKEEDRK